MRARSSLALAAAVATVAGCGALRGAPARTPVAAASTEGVHPWTGPLPPTDPRGFRFVVVTDRTGGHRDGVFEHAISRIGLLQPDFVISVGDLIEGYTEDRASLDRQWDGIEAAVSQLRMPFFYAPGNHDMSNEAMAEAWHSRFGASFYSFVYRDALFLVLNSELFGMVHDPSRPLPGPWTQAGQMAMIERALREHADARWTFVFLHQPLWDSPPVHPDWLRVEEWLGDRPFTVFAGHLHRYTKRVRRDRSFVTLATTGGASALRGPAWGEFDELAQVVMTEEGPVISNLVLDGILGEDVQTVAHRRVVDRLARAVTAEPFLGSDEPFRAGVAQFRIENGGREELRVLGLPAPGRDLAPGVDSVALRVAPRSTARVEIPVRAHAPRRYEELAPGSVRWRLATRDDDGAPVEIELESPILPERRFALRRTRARHATDGDLAEWGPLAFAVAVPAEVGGPGRHDGPDDASFAFDARWDDEALRIAVRIRDDSVVAGGDRALGEQDHLALSIDARPDPERSENPPLLAALRSGVMSQLVNVHVALGDALPDRTTALLAGPEAAGVRRAARRSGDGWQLEVEIPNSVLDARRGGRWDALRLNLTLVDVDAGEPDYAALSWRPIRFGDRAVAGAGTFVRR